MYLQTFSNIVGEKTFWDRYGNWVMVCISVLILLFAVAMWYFAPDIKKSSALAKQRRADRHSYLVVSDGYECRVAHGKTYSPPAPSKDGYTFSGWFVDSALTVPWLSNQPVKSDMTLYPKWSKE